MCRAFGVARSGYYQWQRQGGMAWREQADAVLDGDPAAPPDADNRAQGAARFDPEPAGARL
jgi:hypothetical protein